MRVISRVNGWAFCQRGSMYAASEQERGGTELRLSLTGREGETDWLLLEGCESDSHYVPVWVVVELFRLAGISTAPAQNQKLRGGRGGVATLLSPRAVPPWEKEKGDGKLSKIKRKNGEPLRKGK